MGLKYLDDLDRFEPDKILEMFPITYVFHRIRYSSFAPQHQLAGNFLGHILCHHSRESLH